MAEKSTNIVGEANKVTLCISQGKSLGIKEHD